MLVIYLQVELVQNQKLVVQNQTQGKREVYSQNYLENLLKKLFLIQDQIIV